MFHNPVDRTCRPQSGKSVLSTGVVVADCSTRRKPVINILVQSHKFHAKQEVVICQITIRRVGDGVKCKDDIIPGAVIACGGIRCGIGIADQQSIHNVGRELWTACRNLKFISTPGVGHISIRIRSNPVNASRNDIRHDQITDNALRDIHA